MAAVVCIHYTIVLNRFSISISGSASGKGSTVNLNQPLNRKAGDPLAYPNKGNQYTRNILFIILSNRSKIGPAYLYDAVHEMQAIDALKQNF